MDALQERVEVETAIVVGGHDDLAIDDTSLRQRCEQRRSGVARTVLPRECLERAARPDLK